MMMIPLLHEYQAVILLHDLVHLQHNRWRIITTSHSTVMSIMRSHCKVAPSPAPRHLVEHERVRQQDRLHSPVLRVEALPVVEHRVIGHLACDRIVLEKARDSLLDSCQCCNTDQSMVSSAKLGTTSAR